MSTKYLNLTILVLAIFIATAGIVSAQLATEKRFTVYGGAISIEGQPGSNDIFQIGNAGRDIMSTGPIYVRPGTAIGNYDDGGTSPSDAGSYFISPGGNVQDLYLTGDIDLEGQICWNGGADCYDDSNIGGGGGGFWDAVGSNIRNNNTGLVIVERGPNQFPAFQISDTDDQLNFGYSGAGVGNDFYIKPGLATSDGRINFRSNSNQDVLTIRYNNFRTGINQRNPGTALDVVGVKRCNVTNRVCTVDGDCPGGETCTGAEDVPLALRSPNNNQIAFYKLDGNTAQHTLLDQNDVGFRFWDNSGAQTGTLLNIQPMTGGTGDIYVGDAGVTNRRIDIRSADAGDYLRLGSYADTSELYAVGANNDLTLRSEDSYVSIWDNSDAEVMRLIDGNVGIHQGSPDSPLVVNNNVNNAGDANNAFSTYADTAGSAVYAQQDGAGQAGYFSGETVVTNGNFGVGTDDPTHLFYVENVNDEYERMFFNAGVFGVGKQGAFRAGKLTWGGLNWDDANVGLSSAAFNYNTRASGDRSFAGGSQTIASGWASFSFGSGTQATGDGAVAFNASNATGDWSAAFGSTNIAAGPSSFVIGLESETSSTAGVSFAGGWNAKAVNPGSFVWADYQNPDFTSGADNSFNIRAAGGLFFQGLAGGKREIESIYSTGSRVIQPSGGMCTWNREQMCAYACGAVGAGGHYVSAVGGGQCGVYTCACYGFVIR
ncbi:hypothetical protein ACFL04_05005 [Patescibacteria group bacterium]